MFVALEKKMTSFSPSEEYENQMSKRSIHRTTCLEHLPIKDFFRSPIRILFK